MDGKTKLKKAGEASHEWYVIDVADKVLGRAATKIAALLKGKHQVDYTPHVDSGAGVIVINCGKIRVTGKKSEQKLYTRFSGYPGGLKSIVYSRMFAKDPKYIVRHAVKGMLPRNKLGVCMLKRLKLYEGERHSHAAQTPKEVKI